MAEHRMWALLCKDKRSCSPGAEWIDGVWYGFVSAEAALSTTHETEDYTYRLAKVRIEEIQDAD